MVAARHDIKQVQEPFSILKGDVGCDLRKPFIHLRCLSQGLDKAGSGPT